jgi:predicted transcriptional regulator
MINERYQMRVFDEIINTKHDIQSIAGFVQNSFERMLEDGSVTKEEIKSTIPEMDKRFDDVIENLKKLKETTKSILNHYGK